MSTTTFFFIFIPLLAFILLAVNLIFAPHNAYPEKNSPFECGFHSFLGQNRTQFSVSFFIFALLFLLFDLEILLVYPYTVSAYSNGIYGLIIMLVFFLVLTLGFAFELGKNALKIDSRQMYSVLKKAIGVTSCIGNCPISLASFKGINKQTKIIVNKSSKKKPGLLYFNYSYSVTVNSYVKPKLIHSILNRDSLKRVLNIFVLGFAARYIFNHYNGLDLTKDYTETGCSLFFVSCAVCGLALSEILIHCGFSIIPSYNFFISLFANVPSVNFKSVYNFMNCPDKLDLLRKFISSIFSSKDDNKMMVDITTMPGVSYTPQDKKIGEISYVASSSAAGGGMGGGRGGNNPMSIQSILNTPSPQGTPAPAQPQPQAPGVNGPNANPTPAGGSNAYPIDPTLGYPRMDFFNRAAQNPGQGQGLRYKNDANAYPEYLPGMFHKYPLQLFSAVSVHATAGVAPARPVPDIIKTEPGDITSRLWVDGGARPPKGARILQDNVKYTPFYPGHPSHLRKQIFYRIGNRLVPTHYNSGTTPIVALGAQRPLP